MLLMIKNQQKCQTSMSNIEKNQSPRFVFLGAFLDLWPFNCGDAILPIFTRNGGSLTYYYSERITRRLSTFGDKKEINDRLLQVMQ